MGDFSIGRLIGVVTLRDELSPGLLVASRNVDQFGKRMTDLGPKIRNTGATMTAFVTGPIVALGAVAIKSGSDYIRVMNQVAAVTNARASDMARLGDAAMEWGQKTKFSATEAGQAMLELAKAGLDTDQTIGALPSTLELATAANLNLADAATLTTNVMKTWGGTTADLAKSNDIMAAAANAASFDVADLRESIKYVGPVAAATGISLARTAAATAMLSEAGIKGSMAGTGLRTVLTELLNPSKAAKGVLEDLGFGAEVAAGKMVPLTEVIGALEGRADLAALSMEAFGDRGGIAMTTLATKGVGALTAFEDKLAKSEGTAKRFSDAFMKGLPGAVETMRGSIETASTRVLQAVEPMLIKGAELISRFAEFITMRLVPAFEALPEPIKYVSIGLLAVAAAAGPVLFALGGAISVVGNIARGVAWLTTQLGFLTAAELTNASATGVLTVAKGNLGTVLTTVGTRLAAASGPLGTLGTVLTTVGGKIAGPGGLTALMGGLAVGLMSVGGALLYAKVKTDELKDTFEKHQASLRRRSELEEAFRKTTGATTVTIDVMRLSLEQQDKLLAQAATTTAGTAQAFGGLSITLDAATEGLANQKKNTVELTEAQKNLRDAVKSLRDEQAGLILKAQAWSQFAGSNLASLPLRVQQDYYSALNDVVDAYGSLKAAGLGSLQPTYEWLDRSVGKVRDLRVEFNQLVTRDLSGMLNALPKLEILRDPDAPTPVLDWRTSTHKSREFNTRVQPFDPQMFGPGVTLVPPSVGKTLATNLVAGFTGPGGFADQVGPTIIAALTGGGSASDSVGALAGNQIGKALNNSLSGVLKNTLGKTLGGAVSAMLPGLGAMIGPLISKGLEALGNLIGRTFGNNTKKARDQFAAQMGLGNAGGLYADLESRGMGGDELAYIGRSVIGRNDEAGNARWMSQVTEFYAIAKMSATDLNQKLRDTLATGTQLPAAYGPFLEQLVRSGGLSKDVANSLLGVKKLDWRAMEEAILSVGGSVETLGDQWKAAKLGESADDLLAKWSLLSQPGVDIRNSITAMADEMSAYVQMMQRAGLEIPDDMKPVLQQFADASELIGQNGELLTDLTNLNFGKTMAEQMEPLLSAIYELVGVLRSDLPNAINGLPPINPGVSGPPSIWGSDVPMAHGGYIPPRPGGTRVRAAEAGEGEWFVPQSRVGAFVRAMGGANAAAAAPPKTDVHITQNISVSALDGEDALRVFSKKATQRGLLTSIDYNIDGFGEDLADFLFKRMEKRIEAMA